MKFSRHRARSTALFFFFCSCFGLCKPLFASDLTVVEAVWTRSVEDHQFVDRVDSGARAKPLFFWTRLKGGAKALALLEKQGKLPITHQWSHSNVFQKETDVVSTDQESLPTRTLSAGSISDQGRMLSNGNEFLWRTWSHKLSLRRGTWTVKVKYADGQPLDCGGSECSWTIELK